MWAMPITVTGIPNLIFLQILGRFNKVSSYLHHIGPKLSCYSVHNIYSSGKALYLTQCVIVSPTWGLRVKALKTQHSLW